jgi:hypothetical protein
MILSICNFLKRLKLKSFAICFFLKGVTTMFGRNVCGRERTMRFLLGVLVVVLSIFYGSWIAASVGIYLLLTAIFSYCPFNKALGINSCSLMDGRPSVE